VLEDALLEIGPMLLLTAPLPLPSLVSPDLPLLLTPRETVSTSPGVTTTLDKPSLTSLNSELATPDTELLTSTTDPGTLEAIATASLTSETPAVELPSVSESAPEDAPLDFGLMKLPTPPLLLPPLVWLDLRLILTLLETVSTSPGVTTPDPPSLTSSNTTPETDSTRTLTYPATTEAIATALLTPETPTVDLPLASEYAPEDALLELGPMLLLTLPLLLPYLVLLDLRLILTFLETVSTSLGVTTPDPPSHTSLNTELVTPASNLST
jgi:hypothetical protein